MAARPWAQAPPVRLGGALRSASPSTRQRSRSAARCCADCDVGDRHSKALADKCIRAASPPGLLVSLMMMCAAFLSLFLSSATRSYFFKQILLFFLKKKYNYHPYGSGPV